MRPDERTLWQDHGIVDATMHEDPRTGQYVVRVSVLTTRYTPQDVGRLLNEIAPPAVALALALYQDRVRADALNSRETLELGRLQVMLRRLVGQNNLEPWL